MQSFHIGLDIDGTITLGHEDFEFPLCEKWLKEKGIEIKKRNYDALLAKDCFGFDNKIQKEWMNYFFPINCKHVPPLPAAPESLRFLHREGHRISIITRRDPNYNGPYTGKEMIRDTTEWLERFRIPYDEIHFGSKDKVKVLKEIGADIMIEDEELNILPIAKAGIACIIVGQRYNKQCEGLNPNVVRINSWPKIARFISTMSTIPMR